MCAQAGPEGSTNYGGSDEERVSGWVVYAAVLLLTLGTQNFIEGVAAIGNSHFFVHDTHYVVGSLKTWGWVVLFIGVIQWVIALGLFLGNPLSRWIGVAVLAGNLIVQLVMMPAYPFWSLTIIALDIIAMYGLVVHGKQIAKS